MKIYYFPIYVAVLILQSASPAMGAIHVASTAARNDVSNAVALASSGDIVLVPAGSATWTAGLIISNKTIRLIASGTNSTIITDNIPKTTPETHLIKYYASSNNFLAEIAGFHFTSGSVTQEQTEGRIRVIGDSKLLRVHHNVYTNSWGTVFNAEGFLHGVFDHNRVVTMDHAHPLILGHDAWQPYNGATNMAGTAYNKGHGSWADDPYWGTDKFVFWESNVVEDKTSPVNASGIDIFEGGRFVNRFNVNTNSLLTNHGTEGQGRGHKQSEDYGNLYVGSSVIGSLPQSRGGSILTFSNTFVNISQGYNLVTYRLHFWRAGGWDWAGGTNVYDDNFTNSATAGWWERGNHTGGMDNNGIVDTNKTWATSPQRWLGTNLTFVTRNLTKYNTNSIDAQPHSYVTGNTATTISYSSQDDPNLRFDTGDIYEVWAVNHALDQSGQGKDNGLMTGLPGTPALWPSNATEMCHMWAQSLGFRTSQTGQTEGRDWTNGVAKAGYTPFAFPHYLVAGPGLATTPSPSNGATEIAPGAVILSWGAATNAFFYDVRFDSFNPPTTVLASAQYQQSYALPALSDGVTYYWSIISRNFDGLATNTFSFSTTGIPLGRSGGVPNKRFRPQVN